MGVLFKRVCGVGVLVVEVWGGSGWGVLVVEVWGGSTDRS